MKKVLIALIIVFLTGCSKDKYFVCEINLNNEMQQYNLNAIYKVYYKNTYVTKIDKKEIYTSQNQDTLEYFDEYKNLEYMNINTLYGGTTYKVKKQSDKLILEASLDMNMIDIKKMLKDNYIDKDYVVSNKLTTGGIKNIYKEKGAICDI